jgi:hypothetical protein
MSLDRTPGHIDLDDNLAICLRAGSQYAEAESLDRQLLDIRRRVLGPENSDTLIAMNNLAHPLMSEGRYEPARCRSAPN